MKAALFGRVCAWCSKAPVGVVFIGWSPVADRRHPDWTGSATALFQSRENGCDCRRATKHMATLSFPLTPEMGQPLPFSNIARGLTSDKQVVSQLKFTPPSL